MSLLSANLKAFLAVARLGTVYAAADHVNLTQTGVTQRLRSLEKELKTTLFLRSRKGMRLTAEGEVLLRYCQGVEELEGRTLNQITGTGIESPVHITLVGPTSVMTARVIDQCLPLYRQFPQLYLHFVIRDSVDRLALVRSGQASVAIVPPEQVPNEMDSKRIKPDKYILVASPKWKGRRMMDILANERILDFSEDDSTTTRYLQKFGLAPEKPRLFINNNEAIIKLFSLGIGFGTLTQEIAKSHLDAGSLILLNGGASMEDPLAAVWSPRPEMPNYFRALISVL